MVVGLEIQYGGQNVILFLLSCHRSKICQKDSPHQNIFKLTYKTSLHFVKNRQKNHHFSGNLTPLSKNSVWNQSCQLNVLKKVCPDYPKNYINLLTLTQNIYQYHLSQNNSNTLSNLHETVVSSFASPWASSFASPWASSVLPL